MIMVIYYTYDTINNALISVCVILLKLSHVDRIIL